MELKKDDRTEVHRVEAPDAEFCVYPSLPDERLSTFERLTLTGGIELEKALLWLIRKVRGELHEGDPTAFGELDPKVLELAARYYSNFSGEDFFFTPKAVQDWELTPIHGLRGGMVYDLRIESTARNESDPTLLPTHWNEQSNLPRFRYWKHHGTDSPTVIAVHGWTLGDPRVSSLIFQTGFLFSLGLNVLLYELPFHGRRALGDESSARFPSTDFFFTNETIRQSVAELRELHSLIKRELSPSVGVMGMSLGGYLSSLVGSLEKLDFLVPTVPVVDLAEQSWSILRSSSNQRLSGGGSHTRELLSEVFKVHSPLNYSLETPKERVLIIAGIGDKTVSPRQPKRLWEHWKRPTMHWYRGGHTMQIASAKVLETVVDFWRRIGVVE